MLGCRDFTYGPAHRLLKRCPASAGRNPICENGFAFGDVSLRDMILSGGVSVMIRVRCRDPRAGTAGWRVVAILPMGEPIGY